MKFIPILFSTAMVQAILEGRKTQTRREVKPQPSADTFAFSFGKMLDGSGRRVLCMHKQNLVKDKLPIVDSMQLPYGEPGDVLWVRENILCHPAYSSKDHKAGLCGPLFLPNGENVAFRGYVADWKNEHPVFKVIPSIHMPKPACRIFLEVVSVRVERLQTISDTDAISEGIEVVGSNVADVKFYKDYYGQSPGGMYPHPRNSFKSLWYKINGPESWDSNPWVWVVEFKRIEKPENFK